MWAGRLAEVGHKTGVPPYVTGLSVFAGVCLWGLQVSILLIIIIIIIIIIITGLSVFAGVCLWGPSRKCCFAKC